jgi:hypothetical protein
MRVSQVEFRYLEPALLADVWLMVPTMPSSISYQRAARRSEARRASALDGSNLSLMSQVFAQGRMRNRKQETGNEKWQTASRFLAGFSFPVSGFRFLIFLVGLAQPASAWRTRGRAAMVRAP